ncbi:sialic acid-binding Ig-like lectin 13 [Trichosurus vulpecula]|uniref:sialic acid-binding Ig-like lectin 13 n=1 Tax=Trichosurus vulpecula TaxID=9337 RepID=UPI00186B56A4|nr:sialic acid-binding Ig-like lectin 13 [Trichosurus vulpecula]
MQEPVEVCTGHESTVRRQQEAAEESLSQQHPEFEIHIQETVTVQQGLCVSIPCSFHYPPKYTNNNTTYGYWFYGTDNTTPVATNNPQRKVHPSAQGRFHLVGNLQKDNCSLIITGVQKLDHRKYWFRVEKGNLKYSYSHKKVSVQVEDLTQKPEISIPDILVSGCQVTLNCIAPGSCREGMPPNFLWTGSALSSQGFVSKDLNSSKLLFTPKAQDHGTNLTCQVTFPETKVTTETTVQLRVAYHPRMLGPSCSWAEERSLCTCSVQGDLAPPSLHWWVGESIVHENDSDNKLLVVQNTSRTWTNSSLILAKRLDPGLGIRCEGRSPHGTHSVSVLLLVPGKASSSPWKFLEWITGALCGSIITALLFPCLAVCLIKMFKRKLSKRDLEAAASGTRAAHVSTVNPLAEPENSGKQGPSEHPPSPVLGSCSQEEEDQVQYASISFQAQKPQEIPKPEDTHTEYSELKFQ